MHFFSFLLLLALGLGQQAPNSSIEGTVLRTGTTSPIERAEVTLTRAGETPAVTRTDQAGRFCEMSLRIFGTRSVGTTITV